MSRRKLLNNATGAPPESGAAVRPSKVSALTLNDTPLYSFPSAETPSAYVNGTYYLCGAGEPVKGRHRVTDKASKALKKPAFLFTAGWVDACGVKYKT